MIKTYFHVHVTDEETGIEESIRYFKDYCERNQIQGIGIHAAEFTSLIEHPTCNEKALAVSKADPNWFAFAGLRHARDFVEQTKEYMVQGFKGIKLLEGKPSNWRHYGYTYDAPRFEPFFAFAEEHAIPLLIHNNDPIHHWDINKISKTALEKGWYYDETFPSQEYFFQSLEGVLDRHPNLHAAIAHFGFYDDNIPRAEALMEKCPNLYMDMTPAPIIYNNLSATPEAAKAFILKYSKRLLFGTDVSNKIEGRVKDLNETKWRILTAFYEGCGLQTIGKHSIYGMDLSEDILQDIYHNNAMRFIGKTK